jgi:hypothetical protein
MVTRPSWRPGGRARGRDVRAHRRLPRRPAPTRAGGAGSPPRRFGALGADAPARRRADDPGRPRPVPRAQLPDAPGRRTLRVRLVLGGTAGFGGRVRAADARGRDGDSLDPGRPRRQPAVRAGGGGRDRGRGSPGRRVGMDGRACDDPATRPRGCHGGSAAQHARPLRARDARRGGGSFRRRSRTSSRAARAD